MKVNFSDKQLVFRVIAKKDPDAYAHIYDRYVDALYRFILFKVSEREIAEDLTSDVFLKTWQYLIEYTGEIENIRSLLYKIARNRIIDFYRKRATMSESSLDQLTQPIPDSAIAEAIKQNAEAQHMMKLLQQLKSDYQEVIMLKYIEGFSTKEISQILEKNQSAVRVTLYRAIKRLKSLSSPELEDV